MKYLLLILPLCAGCVTSGDLQAISTKLMDFEEVLEDETATTGEVQAALSNLGSTVDEVIEDVEARSENFLEGLSNAGAASGTGALAVLTGLGVNLFRNSQRRRRGEPVTQAEASKS